MIADEEKQARTFLALYASSCADPVEFIRKRGSDPRVLAANLAAWRQKFPLAGGEHAPRDPLAAPSPPGSAGGDGSSPNANPMGE